MRPRVDITQGLELHGTSAGGKSAQSPDVQRSTTNVFPSMGKQWKALGITHSIWHSDLYSHRPLDQRKYFQSANTVGCVISLRKMHRHPHIVPPSRCKSGPSG